MKTGIIACRSAPTREGIVRRPDHQPAVLRLRQVDRLQQPGDHARSDRMHLGLDRQDQDLGHLPALERPQAYRLVLEHGPATVRTGDRRLAGERRAEELLAVHRQRRTRDELLLRGRPRALRRVHAAGLRDRALEHPLRQRHVGERLARLDVRLHPFRHLGPPAGTATSRTGRSTSRNPSAARSRRRAPCRRSTRRARRCNGRRLGKWPTGTSPGDGRLRAAASGARRGPSSSGCARRVRPPCRPTPRTRLSSGRAP